MLRIALATAALGLASTTASAAELVTNGGFEDPTISNPCCNTVPPANLPGWDATPNVNVVNGTFSSTNGNLAFEGTQYLDLVGEGYTGSISQMLATVAGQLYDLHFYYSHNLFAPNEATSASANVLIDGTPVGFVFHDTGSTSNLDWRPFTYQFTASSNSTLLSFVNLTGGPNEGVFLDAVSVHAVPEPATWAMMLLGFGAVGVAMRRKRRDGPIAQLG